MNKCSLLFYGYVRLSEEDETNTGIETQIKTIEKYVAEKYCGVAVVSKFFIDNGYSGVLTVDERPALKEFFELVSSSLTENTVNLIVYHPDRLSRDSFIFRSITNALSDKCVTLHFVTEGGEGNDTLIFFKTIIAEQERKNTIRRVNNYFKYNTNWDSRVGYGWVWNDVLKKKEQHPEEYANLLLIKKLYEEEYCLLTEIALILKEKGIKKRNGEDWTTTNLEFVIKRNGYSWNKTFIDERKKRVFLQSEKDIVSIDDCEIYKFFFEGKKYCCSKIEKESEIDRKIKEKLHFWIHKEKEKYYSNDELVKKIKSEFPCKETCSKRVLWEFIRDVRKDNN